ncbi:MAG: D-alanyl-D-alanine carboxypeptidase family protein [Deltaproteobacteria bacterium]|nr:D-alanyl-D-alanine carboxypeptidase family protein [Deltaproteobacteria bacterium]
MTRFLAIAALSVFALSGCLLSGCTVASGDVDDETTDDLESEPEEDGREAEGASVGIDCSVKRTDTGYRSGKSFTITVVNADGKPVEIATASMYARMQRAAARDGVSIRVVSGFRTMAQQKYLYNCYITKSCNGGNLAARPGYSNHQSGHALDLNSSSGGVYNWLAKHADEYGFKRTVPSEPWHWEYWGGMVSGGCSTTAAPPPSSGCWSSTLGRQVPLNTCVQSKFDRKWYQCLPGNDWEIRWNVPAACVSEHPL